MSEQRTREQWLVFAFACCTLDSEIALNDVLEEMELKGFPIGEFDRAADGGEHVIRMIYETMSARNSQRKQYFETFSSALRLINPNVWRDSLASSFELSDEEIAEKFGNRPNLLSEIEPGPRRKHLLSPKGLSTLQSGEIEQLLRAIWKHHHKNIAATSDIGNVSSSGTCALLLWRIVVGCQKGDVRLRHLLDVKSELDQSKRNSPIASCLSNYCDTDFEEDVLYRFACQEIGRYWQPLGLRFGISRKELKSISDDFDEFGETYKALAVMQECMKGKQASLEKMRFVLGEIKGSQQAANAEESKTAQDKEKRQSYFSDLALDNQGFYGREGELKTLGEHFFGATCGKAESRVLPISHRVQYICGVGGVGKTRLALRYASLYANSYQSGVFYLDAQSFASLEASLQECLRQTGELGNRNCQAGKNVRESFSRFYRYVQQNPRSLILFDNADCLDDIVECIPHFSISCHVIVTTRVTQSHSLFAREDASVIRLEALDERSAVAALIGLSGKKEEALSLEELEAARNIAVLAPVEGLPIALCHAGAFVQLHEMTFEMYWEKLLAEEKQLDAASLDLGKFLRYFRLSHLNDELRRNGIRHPTDLKKVHTETIDINSFDKQSLLFAVSKLDTTQHAFLTWEMDLTAVEATSPEGFSLLCCCSVVAPRAIPQEVMKEFLSFAHGISKPWKLVKGLAALKKSSLIQKDENTNGPVCYDMHHLVHQSMFHRLRHNRELLEYVAITTGRVLLGVLHRSTIDTAVTISSHFYSVAEKMLLLGMVPDCNLKIIDTVLNLAQKLGHSTVLNKFSLMVVSNIQRKLNRSVETEAATLRPYYLHLANAAHDLGNVVETEKFYRLAFGNSWAETLPVAEIRLLSEDLRKWASACGNLSLFQEAEAILQSLVAVSVENPISAYKVLAQTYWKSCQLEKYTALIDKVLSLAFDFTDADKIAECLASIAHCKTDEENYGEALSLFSQALQLIQTPSQPNQHEEIISTCLGAFICCKLTGQNETGYNFLTHGLPSVRALYHPEHWLAIEYGMAYGESLYTVGNFTEAVDHLRHCVSVAKSFPHSNRTARELIQSLLFLGKSQLKIGQKSEALLNLNELGRRYRDRIGVESTAAHKLLELAQILMQANEFDEAIYVLKSCLLDHQEQLGISLNYEGLTGTCLLASCYIVKDCLESADVLLRSAIQAYDPGRFPDYEGVGTLKKLHATVVRKKKGGTT
ncbi:uncharacterized protein [Oscarella lobularis]|uniref:uncharacterized protein isoform X2 n=1 Tax=Oscarella lobularis TaxID=121494 RepID=UPI003314467C